MRFLHNRTSGIMKFVSRNELCVLKCLYDGSKPPELESASMIEQMLITSDTLWGLALPWYITLSPLAKVPRCTLSEAVLRVEASSKAEDLLLVAYQDGGIISVTCEVLAFQRGARRADWWQP